MRERTERKVARSRTPGERTAERQLAVNESVARLLKALTGVRNGDRTDKPKR
jgi:hypothetical protein